MKKLALGALMIGLLAACGGGGGDGDDVDLIDANGDQPDMEQSAACNPVANTGCAAGEKCTWIDITDTLGTIGCAPDGTAGLGEACTTGAPGETTGYDTCQGGLYCLQGVCQEICTTAPDSCPTTSACSRYSGLFEGADVETGVCDFKCSPGPQLRTFDNGANCGGTDTAAKGCYGWAWGTTPIEFTCTPDISDAVHGQPPAPLNSQNMPYLNSCDAGYFPWVGSFEDTAPDICIAFCQPAETHSGSTGGADGTSPYTCGERGAVAANSMECRYIHIFDQTPDPAQNNSGVCFDTQSYVTDWDGDGPDGPTPMPRCTTLGTALIDTDGDNTPDTPEHLYWGCAPWPAQLVSNRPLGGFRAMLEEKLRERLPTAKPRP